MKGRTLTRQLRTATFAAEAKHLPQLLNAYQNSLTKAARSASEQFAFTASADWQPPVEGTILTAAELAALSASLNKTLSPIWARIVLEIPKRILARVEIAWDITHPLAASLLAQAGQRTGERLGSASQFILRDILAKAYTDGLSVRDTSALIQTALTDAAPWQADMLARTDLVGLSNGASKAAAQLTGMEFKTWLSALLPTTRETHAEAHGQTVAMDSTFIVGGEECDYPGDPALSDGESCNCVCVLAYGETLDEAEGFVASALPTEAGGSIMAGMATKTQRQRRYARRAAHGKSKTEDLVAAAIPIHQTSSDIIEAPVAIDWVSDLAFEGLATDDGRYMMPGAIEWRDLPLPLMALVETGPGGHEGAFQAGKIVQIERDTEFDMDGQPLPEGVVAIRAHGVFDMNGENGTEVERLVREEYVRGVSLDPAGVDAILRDSATGETYDPLDASPEIIGRALAGELDMAFSRYVIGGATVCPIPAFANARIALVASASIWMPLRVLVSADDEIMARCTCARTAAANSSTAAEAGIVAGATTAGALVEPCPIHAAPIAASQSNARADNDSGRLAALNARSSFAKDKVEKNTPHSAQSNALTIAAMSERQEGGGRKQSEDGVSVTHEVFDTEPASGSTGTISQPSWSANTTDARSAESRFLSSQAEEHSRILTWTTHPVPLNSEGGSADHATEALAASATTRNGSRAQPHTSEPVAPLYPPRSWFETTELPGPCPLTISKDGRVYGHIALFNSCHTGLGDQCVKPPRSPSAYAHFHVGEIQTENGDLLPIGKLMLGTKHAPLSMSAREASRHYDDNGMVGAYVCASDGAFGIWVAGCLRHDLEPAHLRDFRANPPSGDWRTVNGQLDMVAALAVPVPGYPVPRAEAALVASGGTVQVASLIASPGHIEVGSLVMSAIVAAGLLLDEACECDEDAVAEREMRVLAARADGLDSLAGLVSQG